MRRFAEPLFIYTNEFWDATTNRIPVKWIAHSPCLEASSTTLPQRENSTNAKSGAVVRDFNRPFSILITPFEHGELL